MEAPIAMSRLSTEAGDQHDLNIKKELISAFNAILADVFVLYMKTKSFHWHITGPQFRDYHLLLDDQASQILSVTDLLAERVRKLGGRTIGSLGEISRLQRLRDSNEVSIAASEMLMELRHDNVQLIEEMRDAHKAAEACGDVATASLFENWIDDAEGRVWFLSASTNG